MAYFTIVLLFVFLGLFKKRSYLIFSCLYLVIFFVSVHFTEGHDLYIYESGYNQPFINSDDEVMYRSSIWGLFMAFTNIIGLNFFQFRILCFLLWSIAIFSFVLKYSKFPSLVIAICTLFPLMPFSMQIRNGVSVAFVYWAFYFYIKNRGVKNDLLYILLIIIAGIIHNVSFFYIAGLLAGASYIKTTTLLRVSLILSFSLFFLLGTGLLYEIMSLFLSDYYLAFYFSHLNNFYIGNLYLIACVYINAWFSYKAEKTERMLIKSKGSGSYESWKLARFVLRLNVILIAAVPLMYISMAFFRIFQSVFILTAVTYTNLLCYNSTNSSFQKLSKMNIFILFYSILTFLYILGQGTFIESWNSIRY